jgi:hypothetical protein
MLPGLLIVTCSDGVSTFTRDLALHHAPVIYQDTDDSDAQADYLTRFNFDGNDVADDNWDNFDVYRNDLRAFVYYSVVETERYWFIVYAFFHPRDWVDGAFDQEHENDIEAILEIVEKDGTEFGRLIGMITFAHEKFYSYIPVGSPLRDRAEAIGGNLRTESWNGSLHPMITIEAKGHGVKAWPFAGDFTGGADQDGIIYKPDVSPLLTEVLPSSGNDRDVRYSLESLSWLLDKQLQEARLDRSGSETYATWGKLKGNASGSCGAGVTVTCPRDAAALPWILDSTDDDITGGVFALDPAWMAEHYFLGITPQTQYVDNAYIERLRAAGYGPDNLPRGWPRLDIRVLFEKAP